MTKRALLAGSLVVAAFAGPASANLIPPPPPPYLTIGWARCTGSTDVACTDSRGDFCTVWTGYRCYVGR